VPHSLKRIALALCLLALPLVALSAPSSASPGARPPTPALLERAVERGDLSRAAADRYLIAAIEGEPIPRAYRSDTPFRGTIPLLELHSRGALHPTAAVGMDSCDLSNAPLPDTIESTHFYIEYSAAAFGGGLTIDDYIAALEGSWTKEVDEFGWAAPPVYTPSPAPNNKYPVRIDPTLGPTLYGFVAADGTHAGFVGNNPATNWNEGDAFATCMVLNSDYDPFPGPPLGALQATAAHEFNHSIQFGWGVLAGLVPDYAFIEGGATWIEDEVFDASNDNYNYLWPTFEDDMGEYKDNLPVEPYEYWITWRGLTEPYGTGIAGGGEDVMERFWESMSKNELDSLDALDASLEEEGTSLGVAFHAYAIAVKFNRPCGGGYASPHCLEEGPAYVAAKGATPINAGSVAMNQTLSGSMADNYSINWVSLPLATDLQAVLKNTSNDGRFRATLACDTGSGLVLAPFTDVVDAGEVAYVRSWKGAQCSTPIAVISNVTQTAPNPNVSTSRTYSLQITPPADPTTLTVKGKAKGGKVMASGKLKPSGGKVTLTLFEKAGAFQEVKSRKVTAKSGGSFKTKFPLPDAKKCRLVAEFPGTVQLLPSTAKQSFSC
jgi:hypothetical protein